MKETPLTSTHIALGAKMAEFAGYNMPIEYESIAAEHNAVREHVGVFDVSHMGEFWVKGPKAIEFLQRVAVNDISVLKDGQAQYNCMTKEDGGIIDDFIVYRINAETFLMVPNAANLPKDWAWLSRHAEEMGLRPGKELYDASDEMGLIAVQGPDSLKVVQKLVDEPIDAIKYYTFKKVNIAGVKEAILSMTGYTGEKGCEIYLAKEDVKHVWDELFKAGAEFGIKPCGLGARDTLRLEMGFCLYGNDICETTNPIEAGLGWITKILDGKEFIGKAAIAKVKEEGFTRKLVAFEMVDRGIPRQHYKIYSPDGEEIGEVTSGTQSPSLKKGIGLGYVKRGFHKVDTEICIEVRKKHLKAKVVKLPFYKKA